MTQRGLRPGLFFRSSISRLTNRKCDRWFTPALSSNPSAVKLGSWEKAQALACQYSAGTAD